MTADRAFGIGWEPQWTKTRFLESIDEQVQDILDLGEAKSSLVDSLFAAARG